MVVDTKNPRPGESPPGIQQECLRRRVTLPHPAGCSTITVPGLSFRVRKGTGRLTWAMTTAKPIQRPTHQGIGRQTEPATRPIPIVAVREPDNGREQKRFTGIVIVTTRNNAPCHPTKETTTGRDPTQQAGRKVCRVRPLVPVGSTPRGASTSGLSTTCSAWGLQELEGSTECLSWSRLPA